MLSSPQPLEAAKLTPERMEGLKASFEREGYLILHGVVSREQLARFHHHVEGEYAKARSSGALFSGGGTISGHLNCFPGEAARFVYDTLQECGIFELVRKLSPQAVRKPNVGCNINLPGSSAQNMHIDGYAADAFLIANGAMEATPRTHKHDYKYHEFVLARHPCIRGELKAGDVMIRPSTLWHRGMPNKTKFIRPMLAFSWEDGGSKLDDPYTAHGGKTTFLPNRYTQNFAGMVRERAFAVSPELGSAYLFFRSLMQR